MALVGADSKAKLAEADKTDPSPMQSEHYLNMVMSRFGEASSLHNAIHALKLREREYIGKNPEQAGAMKTVMEIAYKQLERQRDDLLANGIQEYKIYLERKQNNVG